MSNYKIYLQRNLSFQTSIFDAQAVDLFRYFVSSPFNTKLDTKVISKQRTCWYEAPFELDNMLDNDILLTLLSLINAHDDL